jgi:hypothetical protein
VTSAPPPSSPPATGAYCALTSTGATTWNGYFYGINVVSASSLSVVVALSSTGQVINTVDYSYVVAGGTVQLSNPAIQPGSQDVPVTMGGVTFGNSQFVVSVSSATSSAELTGSMGNCGSIPNGVYSGSNSFGTASLTINGNSFSLAAGSSCTMQGQSALFGTQVVFDATSVTSCGSVAINSITFADQQFQFSVNVDGTNYAAALAKESSQEPSSSIGIIVGVVVGVLVVAGVVGFLVYGFKIRKHQPRSAATDYAKFDQPLNAQ